jgi:DNA mismatch repair protein MutS
MTPMMEQYWKLQSDAIQTHGEKSLVLIEVGAFMEYYAYDKTSQNFENIYAISKLLNMLVTKKNTKKKETFFTEHNPHMLGFPTHSLTKQINILNAHDYTVFLVNQVWDMTQRKPIITDREITRIITPGTYFEEPSGNDVYNVCSVQSKAGNIHHICVIDVSIGKISTMCLTKEDEMYWFLQVYNPIEVICMSEDTHWFEGRITYNRNNKHYFECK